MLKVQSVHLKTKNVRKRLLYHNFATIAKPGVVGFCRIRQYNNHYVSEAAIDCVHIVGTDKTILNFELYYYVNHYLNF